MKKSYLKATMFVVIFGMLFSAVSIPAFGQEETGKTFRLLHPRPDSPTAMVKCGSTIEAAKAEGFAVRYVFTGEEDLTQMQYCVAGKTARVDDKHIYRVPAGTIGWANEAGDEVVLEGCVNKAHKTPPPPAPAPPPAPPIPEVPSITINWTKEAFDTNATQTAVPTGVFHLCAGMLCVDPDSNGLVTQVIPDGDYDLTEKIDSLVWETWDISKTHISKGEAAVFNVTVKNRQLRPEPAPFTPRPKPTPPAKTPVKQPCLLCTAIASSVPVSEIGPKTGPVDIEPKIENGTVEGGTWSLVDIKGKAHVLANGMHTTLTYEMLNQAAKGLKGKDFFLQFSDGKGVSCGIPVKLLKKGRHWFWKLPGVHCLYAYTKDLGNWSAGGTVEKLLACPAEAALAWWLWPTASAALKPNTGTIHLP